MIPIIGNIEKGSRIIVLTGAGMSAESGLRTFRDSDGLWEEYSIYEVATPEAWKRDQELVLRFYNERRKQLLQCSPNAAHEALAALEEDYDVQIITQNVDDLHERAGSSNVLHLHGELLKVRSSVNPNLIYELDGWELKKGDRCERGSQLRPHVVWFGEAVPMIGPAQSMMPDAELILVIGTSLNVYPAAGLLDFATPDTPKVVIDPAGVPISSFRNIHHIREKAVAGMQLLQQALP